MGEIKPGEAPGKIARYIVDLEADRDRASDACASVQRERDALREMLGEAVEMLRDYTKQDFFRVKAFLSRYEGEVK